MEKVRRLAACPRPAQCPVNAHHCEAPGWVADIHLEQGHDECRDVFLLGDENRLL